MKKKKTLKQLDFKTHISGVRNDLKIAIDDLINAIIIIHSEIEELKIKTFKSEK